MRTIETNIKVTEISSYLSNNAVADGGLFPKKQKVNPKLPVILYMGAKVMRKIWENDPTHTQLQKTSDYWYYLSAPFNLIALSILDTGTSGVVVGVSDVSTSNTIWKIRISSSDFYNATEYRNPKIVGRNIEIIDNNIPTILNRPDQAPDFGYTQYGVVFYNIDSTQNSYDYTLLIEGGAVAPVSGSIVEPLIIDLVNQSLYVLNWTQDLRDTYGNFPDFEVWLDQGDGTSKPVTMQPTINGSYSNFTTMTFDFGTPVNGFIRIS